MGKNEELNVVLPKIGGMQVFQPTLTGGGGKSRLYIENHKKAKTM